MKVLVIGGGGREHALAWKMAQSESAVSIFAAPGNAGMADLAECVPVGAEDTGELLSFARERGVDLTVVGPEAPLVAGIADEFRAAGLRLFGFGAAGSRLEGSKVWAKEFMKRHGVPTGKFTVFDDPAAAERSVHAGSGPFVVKVDGLAAGKGVLICETAALAREAIAEIMTKKSFGAAGDRIVMEEFLSGPEVSILALFDGKDYRMLLPSQDHKRAFDGDRGPNTGGMGAYAPVPVVTSSLLERIRREIVEPTFEGMISDGIAGTGVLYFGLIVTNDGPKVLEYNVRFGDPETQVVLPLFGGDLLETIVAATEGRLGEVPFGVSDSAAVCIVVASGGYPGGYKKGFPISGLGAATEKGCIVFHAGTKREGDAIVSAGGRVLGVTAIGEDLVKAHEKAYAGVSEISFEGSFFRSDIGLKGIGAGK